VRSDRCLRRLPLLLLVLTAGCARVPSAGPALPTLSAAEVDHLLTAPLERVRSLQASGVLKLISGDAPLVADMFLAMDENAGVRVDAMTPFDTPLFTSVVTGERITLIDYRYRRAAVGPTDERAALLLLNARVKPEVLRQVAAGGLRHAGPPWVPVPAENPEERELWNYQSGPWRLGIDPRELRPVRLELRDAEPLLVTWDNFREVDGVTLAHHLTIAQPAKKESLMFKLHDVQLNQSIAAAVFLPSIPDGWKVQYLDQH